jgi:cell division septation protein DedD
MRDAYRLKEKIELQLDNRQVVSMAVGAMALLGVAFVVGVMVGKQLAAEGARAGGGPQDPLAALDARTEAQGALFAEVHAAEAREKPAAATVAPEPAVARKAATTTVSVAASAAPAPPTPTSPTSDDAAPADEPSAAAEADAPTPADTDSDAQPAPAPAPAVAPMRPPPGAEDAAAPRPAPGEFTVQVGAYQERTEADGLSRKLRGAGFRPYIVEADIPQKGIWYRVRVGKFTDREAADRYRKDLERELQTAAVIMKE